MDHPENGCKSQQDPRLKIKVIQKDAVKMNGFSDQFIVLGKPVRGREGSDLVHCAWQKFTRHEDPADKTAPHNENIIDPGDRIFILHDAGDHDRKAYDRHEERHGIKNEVPDRLIKAASDNKLDEG